MPELHVLRVFVGPDGAGGNPLGVFLDGPAVPAGSRQAIATDFGFSETVFVDDTRTGALRIFTPATELSFAGHPLVGTAWLLARERAPVPAVRPPAGEVGTFTEDGRTWIRARPEWSPPWRLVQLKQPAEIDALDSAQAAEATYHWAWIDERRGLVRARFFAPDIGIVEDEATGSAAVMMGGLLGRTLTIRQGAGSELLVRPAADGRVEVGGLVELVERREYALPAAAPR